MNLIIDIPEDMYYAIEHRYWSTVDETVLLLCVINGTPLPKGHGDLIDRNKIEYLKALHDWKWNKITASECATKIKYSAPTIIKADTERSNAE